MATAMDALPTRLRSFHKQKRVKSSTAKTATSVSVKWPHPSSFQANPTSLAEAGFYFDPSYTEQDNVTCFLCSKQLSDWKEDDDPFDIHWKKCKTTCAWAVVRCGLKYDLDDDGNFVFQKTRAPTNKAMEKSRLETFIQAGEWPHNDKSHGATPKRMASAGFVYTPQHTGDDLATCLYCSIALSGWEEGDDPLEEHRKRVKRSDSQCPFFYPPAPYNKSTKAASKVTEKPGSRLTRARSIIVTEDDSASSEQESTGEYTIASKKPQSAAVARKSTKTPARKGVTKAISRKKTTGLSAGEETAAEERQTRSTTRQQAKRKGRSKSIVDASEDEPDVDNQRPQRSAKGKPKAKQRLPNVEDPENEHASKPAGSRQRAPKVQSPADPFISVVKDEDERTPQPGSSRDVKTPGTMIRSSSRTGSKMVVEDSTDLKIPRTVKRVQPQVESFPSPGSDSSQLLPLSKSTRRQPRAKASSTAARLLRDHEASSSTEEHDSSPNTDTQASKPGGSLTDTHSQHKPSAGSQSKNIISLLDVKTASQDKLPEASIRRSSLTLHPQQRSYHADDSLTIASQAPSLQEHDSEEDVDIGHATIVDISTDDDGATFHDASSNFGTTKSSLSIQNGDQVHTVPAQKSGDFLRTADAGMQDGKVLQETSSVPQTPPHQKIKLPTFTGPSETAVPSMQCYDDVIVQNASLPFRPPLSKLPAEKMTLLTEQELDMTVEEWIRHEMAAQYAIFKADGERAISDFQKEAEEVRKAIEAM